MNGMQFKAYLKKEAKERNISVQLMLQGVMLDELLERISVSKMKNNFVLKGGFLIASLIGTNTRTTMDLDTTIVGLSVTMQSMQAAVIQICSIHLPDDAIYLEFKKIEPIRKDDEYNGYRVHISAHYFKIQTTIKIDISTGDKITPKEMKYGHKLLTEERTIHVMAYNIETILAEKMESIISRSIDNTRAKDFYDVYMLEKLEKKNIDFKILRTAIKNTSKKRGSLSLIPNYLKILKLIEKNPELQRTWRVYAEDNDYAMNIEFSETCLAVRRLFDCIFEKSK